MSQVSKEEIICPKCQAKGEFEVWESMNVDLDPTLRDKVLNEKAFIYTCPECGHQIGIPYGTLYHDMTHHFMLFFDFFKPEDFNYEPIEIPVLPSTDNYIYRHVTGLWALKEKIYILEKGLNDIAIERMKYMLTHVVSPEMATNKIELFFGDVEIDDDQPEKGTMRFIFHDKNDEPMIWQVSMQMYYEHCLACDLDPRMKCEGCMNIDAGWIERQLKLGAV